MGKLKLSQTSRDMNNQQADRILNFTGSLLEKYFNCR